MYKIVYIKSVLVLSLIFTFLIFQAIESNAQSADNKAVKKYTKKETRIFYGLASFYANKFHGRRTANGEIFSQAKMTAACNVLPLGTWIQVTNLKNGKIVVVKTIDRLHPRMKRLIDLSRTAASKLGFISRGVTRVKVVVLNQKLYK